MNNSENTENKLLEMKTNAGFAELIAQNVSWLLNCTIITAIATLLRFVFLEIKPMHHDEGVNGHFLTILFREGVYKYDPANYHGPDLYYISLAFSKILGLNTLSVRSSVAIFGVLTVILAFFLRRYIGTIGSLAAALFLALSPGMVYISRYFIHEILFVFFSLSFVVAILYFIEKRKAGMFAVSWMTLVMMVCFLPSALLAASYAGGENAWLVWTLRVIIFLIESVLVFFVMRMLLSWDHGRPIYFMLASVSLVMLFATKETAFITVGTMVIASVCIWGWRKLTSLEAYSENRSTILLFVHGILMIVGAVLTYVYSGRLLGFYKWFYAIFASPDVPDQKFLFYTIVLLGILGVVTWVFFFMDSKEENANVSKFFEPTWKGFRAAFGDTKNAALILFAAVLIFAYIGVLFFSSFFTYPNGVKGAFEAYAIWTKTGSSDHTQNGLIAYFKWMAQIESPLIVLSVLGTLIAVINRRHRFAMFAGLWAFGLFLAYSVIPYKTPWLALSFTLPMCLIGGYAINELAVSRNALQKILAGVLSLLAVFVLTYQMYDQNFERYDSDRLPYVYAHTEGGFLDLIRNIEEYAYKSGKGKDATIEIVSGDYWPMPWYTKDYPKANFHGKLVDANTAEMIVASKAQFTGPFPNDQKSDEGGSSEDGKTPPDQEKEAPVKDGTAPREDPVTKYGTHYKYVGTYPLRPGVNLYLLVRKDIAGPEAKELANMPSE